MCIIEALLPAARMLDNNYTKIKEFLKPVQLVAVKFALLVDYYDIHYNKTYIMYIQ